MRAGDPAGCGTKECSYVSFDINMSLFDRTLKCVPAILQVSDNNNITYI